MAANMDATAQSNGEFRGALTQMGLTYAVGVQSNVSVWPSGVEPLPAKEWSGRGRRSMRLRRDADQHARLGENVAMSLLADAFDVVTWREGVSAPLAARFAALRVRPALNDKADGAASATMRHCASPLVDS